MFKKSLVGILILSLIILLAGASLAGTENTDNTAGGTVQETPIEQTVITVKDLSLDEALALAQENNSLLKQAEIARDKSRIQTSQASSAANKMEDQDATTLETGKIKYYNEDAARAAFEVAEKAYAVAFEQVKLLVKTDYLDVLKKRELVNVKQETVERAGKQLDMAKINFEVGTVAKHDVLTAEVGLAQANAELTTAKNNLQLAEITLNTALGLPTGTALNLTSTVQYEAFAQTDLVQVINDAMANHLEIAKSKSAMDLANENYKLVVAYSAPNTYSSRIAKCDLDSKTLDFEDAKNNVVANITGCYLNVLATEEAVKTYTAAVEQARESARLTSLRYEVGMATSLDALNASVQLSTVEASSVDSIYNHYLAKIAFETSKLALTR